MKNRKHLEALEKSLPYPRLSIQADRRFDQILADLPDKTGVLSDRLERLDDPTISQRVIRVVPEPEEEGRWVAGIVGKWALAAVAVAVVALLGVNSINPAVTEKLPVLGNVFSALNRSNIKPDPTIVPVPSPTGTPDPVAESMPGTVIPKAGFYDLPVEDNGTVLTSVEWENETTLKVTGTVPFMGRESYDLLKFYNSTPLGVSGKVYGTGIDENTVEVEIENEHELFQTRSGDGSTGSPMILGSLQTPQSFNVTWRFRVDPAANDVVTLCFFEHSECAALPENRLTAQFSIDLKTFTVAPGPGFFDCLIESGPNAGKPFQKATPEEVLATPRNGEFTNGWYAEEPYVVTDDSGIMQSNCKNWIKVVFYGDPEDTRQLVLQANVDTSVYDIPGDDLVGITAGITYDRATLDQRYNGRFTVGDGGLLDEVFGNVRWYCIDANNAFIDMNPQGQFDFTGRCGANYRRVVFAVSADILMIEDDADLLRDYLDRGIINFQLFRAGSIGDGDKVLINDVQQTVEQEQQQRDEAYQKLAASETSSEPDPSPDAPYENHFSLIDLGGNDPNVLELTPNLDASQYGGAFSFLTDLEEDLPWVVRITMGGDVYEFPLYPSDTVVRPPESTVLSEEDREWLGKNLIASGAEYAVYRIRTQPEEYDGPDVWRYTLSLYRDGSDGSTYDWNGCTWAVVNPKTDEIVYDSAEHRRG